MKKSFINFIILLFIISIFVPIFYVSYFVLLLALIYLITKLSMGKKIYISNVKILNYGIILFIWAYISWIYNNFLGNSDLLSLFFWSSTFLFPFFLIFFTSLKENTVSFEEVFDLYKKILIFQFIIGIIQAISTGEFAGDHIKGTCIDSHTLGVFYAIASVVTFTKSLYLNKMKELLYCLLYLIGIIMTGYTSNVVFLSIILTLIILIKTKLLLKFTKISLIAIFTFFVTVMIFSGVKHHGLEYVKYGISVILENLNNLEKVKLSGKIYSYKVAFYDIPNEINIFLGYGPATYTSRASQMRIPEVATKKLPIKIQPFRTKLFEKYILSWFIEGPDAISKGASWGTLASPMTSVISIWVELGVGGFIIFVLFFVSLLSRLNKLCVKYKNVDYQRFVNIKASSYLILLFIIEMFYLNYWEYPQITIPIFILSLLSIK